jgi:hypothetical protein
MAFAYRTERTVSESSRTRVHPTTAAAYCGAAHGVKWQIAEIDAAAPAETVELAVKDGTAWYRLVRHPRTGAPALDRLHRLIYVPAQAFRRRPPRTANDSSARVGPRRPATTSGRVDAVSDPHAG